MNKVSLRVWYEDVRFEGRQIRLYYTVPDMFFDYSLFICLECTSLFGVNRDAERYLKRDFEAEKDGLVCPTCSGSLRRASRYPDTFLWDDFELGYFDTSRARPSSDRMETIEVWDPLSE